MLFKFSGIQSDERGPFRGLACAAIVLGCGSATAPAAIGTAGASSGTLTGSGGTLALSTVASTAPCVAGTERCPCYGNHTCNDGLICASDLCVNLSSPAAGGASATTFSSGGASNSTSAAHSSVGGAGQRTSAPVVGGAENHATSVAGNGTGGSSRFTTPPTPYQGGAAGAYGTGDVAACQGVIPAPVSGCVASSAVEARPLKLDLVLLLDRSISMSYAVGSELAAPANSGQLSRWNLLTAGLGAFLSAPDIAASVRLSLTVFSYTGSAQQLSECNSADYAQPLVALDTAVENQAPVLSVMQTVVPAGLSPIVPALTGVFQYAMAEQDKDLQREKVVVYVGDGFPTLCDRKSPADVSKLIAEAAAAPTPIRTFIVGFGSPETLQSAQFNLQNYARAGNGSPSPYVIDETAGTQAAKDQLVSALRDIAAASGQCVYALGADPPNLVALTRRPSGGELQEVPRVPDRSGCDGSPHGGWYFDDPIAPKFIHECPCTCANRGSGQVSILYGCAPSVLAAPP